MHHGQPTAASAGRKAEQEGTTKRKPDRLGGPLGRVRPVGRLPFELPRSMAAVRLQQSDVSHHSDSPPYALGIAGDGEAWCAAVGTATDG